MVPSRSLFLIKPDAVERRLVGEIISRLEKTPFRIVAMRMLRLDPELAGRHYEAHRSKDFYPALVEYITSGPAVAMIVEGEGVVDGLRALIGATDPSAAAPGTIRGDLGLDIRRNLVHASDSPEAAEREVSLFFPDPAG